MKKNELEWTVFGTSLAIILAVAGLLVYQIVTGGGERPALLAATIGAPLETADGYALPIDVRNEGDVTAEDVRIQATLNDSGTSQISEAVVPYVPYHAQRRVWVTFSRDPRAGTVTVRVSGYREP
jgi:uncharacterized protein (TIGR02588 family)